MRAKPLIIWGLLASLTALSMSALALGLGRLSLDSGLGQPLSARVELTAAQKDELDSLVAKVADLSIYRDNNVQYPAALSRARVTVEQSPNNPPYLKVTTTQAVNEPYLDLIVEVNWATGRVIRNYTFLLDPPGTAVAQAVEPIAPVRTEAAPARAARSPRALPAAAGPKAGGGDTYTVHRGDTLSKIAKEYKPENVSLEQMLVALFRSNESAFDGRNMNRLRSGQILTIPPVDQAAAATPTEAKQVVRVQASDWRAYRDRLAAAAPTTVAGERQQGAGGKITTAVEDKGAATQPGKDQLRVSREAGKAAAASRKDRATGDHARPADGDSAGADRRCSRDSYTAACGRAATRSSSADEGGRNQGARGKGARSQSSGSQSSGSQGAREQSTRNQSAGIQDRGDAGQDVQSPAAARAFLPGRAHRQYADLGNRRRRARHSRADRRPRRRAPTQDYQV